MSLKAQKKSCCALISVSEVEQKLGETDFFTFDCTSYYSYLRQHIPGAKNISISSLPENPESTLVFYSKNPQCKAATLAANNALRAGYRNIFVMRAGLSGWASLNKVTTGSSRQMVQRATSLKKGIVQ